MSVAYPEYVMYLESVAASSWLVLKRVQPIRGGTAYYEPHAAFRTLAGAAEFCKRMNGESE
jgi:hypothetical protein